MGLHAAPTDLAAIEPSFGAAHLFIDSIGECDSSNIVCTLNGNEIGQIWNTEFGGHCSTYGKGYGGLFDPSWCRPCNPYPDVGYYGEGIEAEQLALDYWQNQCNVRYAACNGSCWPKGFCYPDGIMAQCPQR